MVVSKIIKAMIPGIYKGVRKLIEWSWANVSTKPTQYDGGVTFNFTPEVRDDGVEVKVQLDGHTSVSKDIVICGKTVEVKASGDGHIGGKWHLIFKEK